MLEQIEQFCRDHALLKRGDRIVVACSGGPDSLALLVILWRLRHKYALHILAAHFEHGIRGEDSQADAAFVQEFCEQRKIPVRLASADVPASASVRGISLETAARELRYQFLERVRVEEKCDAIAVAHHADDQAETVLMRILRGTGTQGLAAMRPRSGRDGHIIRPLLGVTKAAIREFCAVQGLQPREDSTNAQADCTRNRLRLETLPLLKQAYNPELTRALCQLAEVSAAESDYFEQQIGELWRQEKLVRRQTPALCQQEFARLPLALQRGLIRRFWQAASGSRQDLGFVQAEKLRSLLLTGTTGSRLELAHGFAARLAYGWLTCGQPTGSEEAAEPVLLQIPGATVWGSYCCRAEWREELPAATSSFEFYLQPDELAEPIVIRRREPGDMMQLPGGRKKLKKLLIDDKIPQQERDQLPIIAAGHEVLWVAGHRRSSLCPVAFDRPIEKKFLYLKMERREEIYHDER
ncbi:tRNA lysidine(34) synthetase TilS [Selenomonas sp. GACV-9]|uniref:tRNA lysidine(34) synthetase TilS n=1 Tax=Selenomonas sp. GACV-9 TaxID=3158782 RepID=UPI0015A719C9